jgi:hypothetical protein
MALAEVIREDELGERRWADWWALPSGDVVLGGALLDVFEAWDGDDSAASPRVNAWFVALDRRLMAYEDWCAGLGIEPARRPRTEGPGLRLVGTDEGPAGRELCGDCHGSAVMVDDGSLSGRAGTLVECSCASLLITEVCAKGLGRTLTPGERQVALLAEYVTRCQVTGTEPDWCLSCGEPRPTGAGPWPLCACEAR